MEKKNLKNGMRLNSIELRKSSGKPVLFEIVKMYPNELFGKEGEFERLENGMYHSKTNPHSFYSSSCFEREESCCVIAFIEHGQVKFVGDRAIELDDIQDYKDFLFILRKGISKSLRWKEKK